jgi:hypothetical protein
MWGNHIVLKSIHVLAKEQENSLGKREKYGPKIWTQNMGPKYAQNMGTPYLFIYFLL